MLSLFPDILFLAPVGTTLLRVVAGLFIIYAGYRVGAERERYSETRFPIIGNPPELFLWIGVLITFAIGLLLVVGLFTQAAAILGALAALKIALFNYKYPGLMPLSVGTAMLLFAVCLSLLVMGPGIFAFDLPL